MRCRFHRVPLAELLVVAGLFWSVVCGDVVSVLIGNRLFVERSKPRTLGEELGSIRDEEAMRETARRVLGNVRQSDPWLSVPTEGKRDVHELVLEHTRGIGQALADGSAIGTDSPLLEPAPAGITTTVWGDVDWSLRIQVANPG